MSPTELDSDVVWEGALTCPCGRPYIVLKVDELQVTKNRELQALATYVRCPVHRRVRRLFLPYSRLTEWIGAVGDRLFRCNACGERAHLQRAGVRGHFSVILLDCPLHGNKDNKRILWSPIYTSAKAIQEIHLTEDSPITDVFDESLDSEPTLICTKCQTENDSDARFCAYCGARQAI